MLTKHISLGRELNSLAYEKLRISDDKELAFEQLKQKMASISKADF